MPINYALFENNLTSDPNDFMARIEDAGSANLPEIVQQMLDQGSTTTSADIYAVLEDVFKAVEALLLLGYRVNLGDVAQFYDRMQGVFDGPNDKFDPSRHKLDVGVSPGQRLRDAIREHGKVKKDEAIIPTPDLIQFQDLISHTHNIEFRPGGVGTIIGHRLQHDETQADEGIFFIDSLSGVQTKVALIQKNMPAELIFVIPDTLVGPPPYYLEVRARLNGGAQLRTGRLDATLVVS